MRFLDRVDISGSVNMASLAKDTFIIGTPLENNDGNVDTLQVHANADFKNNVIIGSSDLDTLSINAKIVSNLGNITASCLFITGGTIYYNGMDLLASMMNGGGQQGGGNQQGGGGIQQIVGGTDIDVNTNNGTATISFRTSSLEGYKFLQNENSYSVQAEDKTVYFSFSPHYNSTTYFNNNTNQQLLRSADFAVSDISMSISLPPVETHLGKTFTFINASYVGTSSNDTVGYTGSSGQSTVSGNYSVHKISFNVQNGNYFGSSKITGKNNFSFYLVSSNIKENTNAILRNNYENVQHNFITLQAISSSQYGYSWMIRDVNDYEPFYLSAV